MSTRPGPPSSHESGPTAVDELFATATPVRSGDDLARDGVFDDGEIDEFLAELQKMRRSDIT